MGKIYFNYKKRKYAIDFINKSSCIIWDLKKKDYILVKYSRDTKISEVIK